MDLILLSTSSCIASTLPSLLLSPTITRNDTGGSSSSSSTSYLHKNPTRIFQPFPLIRMNYFPLIVYNITLLLSLWLFTISFLEIAPYSWSLLLNNASSLKNAYRFILGWYCIWICLIIPIRMGLLILEWGRSNYNNYNNYNNNSYNNNWCFIALKCLFRIQLVILRWLWNVIPWCGRGRHRRTTTIPKTNKPKQFSEEQKSRNVFLRNQWQRCNTTTFIIKLTGCGLGIALSFISLQSFKHFVLFLPITTTPPHHDSSSFSMMILPIFQLMLSRICSVGIVFSTLINGFGSVSLPYSCLIGLYYDPVAPETLRQMESEYARAVTYREQKRTSKLDLSATTATAKTERFQSSRNCFLRTPSRVSNDDDNVIPNKNEMENCLDDLVEELRDDIDEMKFLQQSVRRANTFLGNLTAWGGRIFSVVLVLRLVLAFVTIQTQQQQSSSSTDYNSTDKKNDFITIILSFLVQNDLVTNEHFSILSQGSSLLITAILSVSQVQTFLRMMLMIQRRLSCCVVGSKNRNNQIIKDNHTATTTTTTNGNLVSHVMAFFMGSYCLSCVFVSKMMLPMSYRIVFNQAVLGDEEEKDVMTMFRFNGVWIQTLFLCCAVVTILILGSLSRIRRYNSKKRKEYSFLVSKEQQEEEV